MRNGFYTYEDSHGSGGGYVKDLLFDDWFDDDEYDEWEGWQGSAPAIAVEWVHKHTLVLPEEYLL